MFMSTCNADVRAQAQETGFSREGVEAISRARIETGASRDARMRAWELYESLPMPTAHRRGVAPHRPARSEARSAAAGRRCRRRPAYRPCRRWKRPASRTRPRRSRSDRTPGVVVQRDAATILTTLDPEVAAKGVIFTDLATATREHPELVERYFMTQAVPPSLGKFEALHAAYWQGGSFLYVPEGRHRRSAIPRLQPAFAAGSGASSPTPWPSSRKAPRRSSPTPIARRRRTCSRSPRPWSS